MEYEIQFEGYEITRIKLAIQDESQNPFENLDRFDANEVLTNAVNYGDEDENGWITVEVGGERCQIRKID